MVILLIKMMCFKYPTAVKRWMYRHFKFLILFVVFMNILLLTYMVNDSGDKRHFWGPIIRHERGSPNHREAFKPVETTDDLFRIWSSCTSDIEFCPHQFQEWIKENNSICNPHFVEYANLFTLLNNVTIDRRYAIGQDGGQDLELVMNQPEEKELFQFQPGFLTLPCDKTECEMKKTWRGIGTQLYNWSWSIFSWLWSFRCYFMACFDRVIWSKIVTCSKESKWQLKEVETIFTVAVLRYEYANIYHTMTDLYNAFLMVKFFRYQPKDVNIIFLDAHPKGSLDSVWSQLFRSTRRLGQLTHSVHYNKIVMDILGYDSYLDPWGISNHMPKIPMLEQFREFFLQSYDVVPNKKLDCRKISILFLWRRNYVSHPRNPKGTVQRKFYNENELVSSVKMKFASYVVNGVQIDLLDIKDQLDIIANTDILIGMHGAGLTHTLFLPRHSCLIEYFPKYVRMAGLKHFKNMAKWRGLQYQQWQNTDSDNEFSDFKTKIPPEVVQNHINKAISEICTGG